MTRPRRPPPVGQLALLPDLTPARPARRGRAGVARIPTTSTHVASAPPVARPMPIHSHGPTRRRQPGELTGPAPTSHQVRQVPLVVEQLPDNRWKLSLLRAPDAAWVASRPDEVARAIRSAFTEAQIESYSSWKGTVYDVALPSYKRSRPTARSRKRCDVYSADMWRLDPDDNTKWISPKGLRFPEERQVVQRVIAARVQMGLPPRPDTPVGDGSVTPMTARTQPFTHQQRGRTA